MTLSHTRNRLRHILRIDSSDETLASPSAALLSTLPSRPYPPYVPAAAFEFVQKSRKLYALPIDVINPDFPPEVNWITEMGRSPIRNAMNASMLFADERSASHASKMSLSNIVIVCVAESLFVVVICCIMVPVAFQVLQSKQSIYDTFLEVPVPVVKALHKRVSTKIAALARAAEQAELGIDIGATDDVDDGDHDKVLLIHNDDSASDGGVSAASGLTAALNAEANKRTQQLQRVHTGDDNDADDGYSGACGCLWNFMHARGWISSAATAESRKKRHFKRATSQRNSLLLNMLWPMVCYMVYFIGVHFWKEGVVNGTSNSKAAVLYSKQVEFYIGQINFNLRNGLFYCEPNMMKDALDKTDLQSVTTEAFESFLLYGDTLRNLKPSLQENPNLFHLWMENGCVQNDGGCAIARAVIRCTMSEPYWLQGAQQHPG